MHGLLVSYRENSVAKFREYISFHDRKKNESKSVLNFEVLWMFYGSVVKD